MAERSKAYLKQEFRDGERPTGTDFSDLIDSFMSKVDDVVVDGDGNLELPKGINVGDVNTGQAGTLRYHGGQLQIFDGATWSTVGGSAGAFLPVAGGPSVAFNGGNVGIGNFPTAPTFKLDIPLGANTSTNDQVRIGNAVISNGQGASVTSAQFAQQNFSTSNNNFALRQGSAGDVNLNAPAGQPITISHARVNARVYIDPTGPVVIGGNALLSADATNVLQVNGKAVKNGGGNTWDAISDGRFKQDVKPFEDGLTKLLQVRPVKFRYNGKLNTNPNVEEVGVIAQEIHQVFPYMTSGISIDSKEPVEKDNEVMLFNSHALTFVMVNAIQELAVKVKELESILAKERNAKA